jgi:L-aspartate oxidase
MGCRSNLFESFLNIRTASMFSTVSSSATPSGNDRLLVVGSGVAGSAAALTAAETYKIPVTLLYAGNIAEDCNSNWAQGGIIYRNYDPESGDSADLLAQDIHRAGAGLCDDAAVRKVSNEGPDRVRELLLSGGPFAKVPFDKKPDGELSLCLEASHSSSRILHYADHTGMIITQHITRAAARHPLITLKPQTLVTDIIVEDDVCVGVETLNRASGKQGVEFATRGTVLATGGLGGIYEHSTNPAGFNALGSSAAIAVRAGVNVQDLEYVQFHPTSLYIPGEARFLLTEALRGEGAILRNGSGRAFAKDFHPDGELAPRDIVARGVFDESQKSDSKHNVFLDITHRDADWLHARFPSIQGHLSQRGLDLAKDRLPIIPAAHYTCGGISTDLKGQTSLRGLFAAGEAARTGLHGGNRLASTSLLEGLVFGASVADTVGSDEGREMHAQIQQRLESMNSKNLRRRYSLEPMHIENAAHRAIQLLRQVRRVMWDHVGVVRTPSGLSTALDALSDIREEAGMLYQVCPTLETSGVRDAAYAGEAVAKACCSNLESAGAHYVVPDSEEYSDDEPEVVGMQ